MLSDAPDTDAGNGRHGGGEPAAAGRVAVVLPGGGARGAYEIGALSVILPRLEERGEHVSIWCGTSAGAINAALLSSLAHLPASEQVARALACWQDVERADVFAPLFSRHALETVFRLVGELAGVPGVRFRSLLDVKPLRRSLDGWIDWRRLQANVDEGFVDATCVVATAVSDGWPVGFVAGGAEDARWLARASEDVRYVPTTLTAEHVRASAAIPILFPAVKVRTPDAAAGFYLDGGTRLNTPLKPALDLGAQRIVVIGFEPLNAARMAPERDPGTANLAPHLGDIAANALDGLLLDQVNADLHRMAAINLFFAGGSTDAFAQSSGRGVLAYREARGRHPYRRIDYAIVTPPTRRALGELAEEVVVKHYTGLRALRHPDYLVAGRLLGSGPSRGELLSLLLFDRHYTELLIEAGRRDAQTWLDRHPRLWCTDSRHDFDLDPSRAEAQREAATRDEWRELRRRTG
jgi:NTE family protein